MNFNVYNGRQLYHLEILHSVGRFSTPEKTAKHKQEEENLLQQVTPGEGLEVVKDLMVDDDVEVNLKVISSEYGGGLLMWKKGDEKDNDDKKDIEKNVKSKEEEQLQVTEEDDSKPPTVVAMVVAEVAKIDILFFNQEEVVGKAYQFVYLQASADQTTVVSVKEQTLEVEKTEDETSQASADQTTVVSVEEQTIEVAQTDVAIFHQEEDVGEASQSKEGWNRLKRRWLKLVLMESEVDVTLKKRHALTKDEINERTFIMACQMNQLHTHLDELLPGVLLEYFIQRPIS
ncbi:hypothetical protein GIB67_028753 [Kingdonia uniflora]|uniref:Uncharacterized protein n=1 Tax=Kingdonia uniflora TaxID=39325 RepID=A0A7J7NQH0_9MAGN|nr:hypothetical protein GIB67_028753 [Kingdonia uniflora]